MCYSIHADKNLIEFRAHLEKISLPKRVSRHVTGVLLFFFACYEVLCGGNPELPRIL